MDLLIKIKILSTKYNKLMCVKATKIFFCQLNLKYFLTNLK